MQVAHPLHGHLATLLHHPVIGLETTRVHLQLLGLLVAQDGLQIIRGQHPILGSVLTTVLQDLLLGQQIMKAMESTLEVIQELGLQVTVNLGRLLGRQITMSNHHLAFRIVIAVLGQVPTCQVILSQPHQHTQ